MIFNTWIYGAFLATFSILYWTVIPSKSRPMALVLAGLVFYTYYYPVHTLLIVSLLLAAYGFGTVIYRIKFEKSHGELVSSLSIKAIFIVSLAVCLGALAYYKYLKLFASALNHLSGVLHRESAFTVPDLVVPLGLSFLFSNLSTTWRTPTKAWHPRPA